MTQPTIEIAQKKDTDLIIQFLMEMQEEVGDFSMDLDAVRHQIIHAKDDNAVWFIFYDEQNQPFGTGALQSVYNYWRIGKRFLVTGLYIRPSHRPGGQFKKICALLKEWATAHGGVMFNAIISDHNRRSILACKGLGMKPLEDHTFYYVEW